MRREPALAYCLQLAASDAIDHVLMRRIPRRLRDLPITLRAVLPGRVGKEGMPGPGCWAGLMVAQEGYDPSTYGV